MSKFMRPSVPPGQSTIPHQFLYQPPGTISNESPFIEKTRNFKLTSSSATVLGSANVLTYDIPMRDFLDSRKTRVQFNVRTKQTLATTTANAYIPHSAVFVQRMKISCGPSVLYHVDNYNMLYSVLEKVVIPDSYKEGIGSVQGFDTYLPPTTVTNQFAGDGHNFMLDLLSVFDQDKYIPLQFLGDPLRIEIQFVNPRRILDEPSFDYEIRKPELLYTLVTPRRSYLEQFKANLMEQPISIKYTMMKNFAFTTQAGQSFDGTIRDPSESMLGFVMVRRKTNNESINKFINNGFQSLEVHCDSHRFPEYIIDTDEMAIVETAKIFSDSYEYTNTGSMNLENFVLDDEISAVDFSPKIPSGDTQAVDNNGTPLNVFIPIPEIPEVRFQPVIQPSCVLGACFRKHHDSSSMGQGIKTESIQINQKGNTAACEVYVWTIKEAEMIISNGKYVVVNE